MTKKVQKSLVRSLYCVFLFLKCEEINLKTIMMLLFFLLFSYLAGFRPGYLVVDMRSMLFYVPDC